MAQPPRGGMQDLVEPVAAEYDIQLVRATGTRGVPVHLFANANKIFSPGKEKFDPPENARWYKYQVTILPTRTRAASGLPPPLPPKQLLRKIWAKLEETEKSGVTSVLGGVLGVYDGRNACFTSRTYPDSVISTTVTLPQRGTFSLAISNPIEIKVHELKKWWLRQSAEHAHVAEALAALNTLWVHGLSTAFLAPANRTTTFIGGPEAAAMGLGKEFSPKWIGGGLELWRGVFQAIKLTPSGPSLIGNLTSGSFVRPGSLLSVLLDFLRLSSFRDLDAAAMTPKKKGKLNRFFSNVRIDIFPPTDPKHKHACKARGITDTSARETYFTLFETNEKVSVEDYFWRTYQIRLDYPHLPCVELKAGICYPIEVLCVPVGNKYRRKLDAAQQKEASPYQVLPPEQRFGFYEKLLKDGDAPQAGQPLAGLAPASGHIVTLVNP